MRKSERIRILELSVLKLEMQVETMSKVIDLLIDNVNSAPQVDSGKWYPRRPDLGN